MEARKLLSMEKKEVPYLKNSLVRSVLSKGPSSLSEKEHANSMAATERLFISHTAGKNIDRILQSSVPSPGIGH